MKDLNRVELIGHLGGDPTVVYTDVGTARTTVSVATSRHWTDADGQAQVETEWTRCTTWSKLAEIAAQYLHKGSRVYIAGRLHTSRWEDVQTGEPHSSVEIILDDLILLDRPMPGGRAGQRGTGAKHASACAILDRAATDPPATRARPTL